VHYEKQRFYLWQVLLVGSTIVLFWFVLVPILLHRPWSRVAHLFFCVGPVCIGIGLPWAVFTLRFFFLSSMRRLTERLARYGPPDEVMKRIDAELSDLSHAFVEGRFTKAFISPQPDCLILTENWLLRFCPAGSAIIHLPDLVWIWRRVVARSAPLVMGRIDHQLGCRMANGDEWLFDTWTERRTDLILQEIIERKPELLAGYRGEWHDLAARGEVPLRTEIQNRREQFGRLSAEEQEKWLDQMYETCHRYVYRVDRQLPDGS
jgi:hypothetical protein